MRAALVMIALVLALPGAAHAHAELVASSPRSGAQVDAAPGQVSLRFNEPVEAGLGALRVFDGAASAWTTATGAPVWLVIVSLGLGAAGLAAGLGGLTHSRRSES